MGSYSSGSSPRWFMNLNLEGRRGFPYEEERVGRLAVVVAGATLTCPVRTWEQEPGSEPRVCEECSEEGVFLSQSLSDQFASCHERSPFETLPMKRCFCNFRGHTSLS